MFIAVLFGIATNWKQSEYPSIDECINNLWSTHTMEYYSALKRNKLSIHKKLDESKIIMLSEISQTKQEYICLHLHKILGIAN